MNATNDMKIASAITSAIDHLEDSTAKNLASLYFFSKDGSCRHRPTVMTFRVGKTTLNIRTSTATTTISGWPIVSSVRNTYSTLLLW